jgi:RNA polymerase sigma factor (sigma-70 family)
MGEQAGTVIEGRFGAREDELSRWRQDLLRYVHRLTGDADLAEDVVQDALIRYLAFVRLQPLESPRGWLFRTATNLVRDHARRQGVLKRVPMLETEAPAVPDAELERKEAVRQVRRVLDGMSPRDREILILRESGFRYREIAEVIGVKPESVPTLVMRALRRFREGYTAERIHDTPH